MIAALVPFLTGPAGKLIGIVAGAAMIVAGGIFMLHEHDVKVRAEQQVAAQAAAIATLNAQHAAAVAALESVAKQAQDRAAGSAQIRSSIHAAPSSSACAGSPTIAAALDGLRKRTNPGGGAVVGAAKPADVQR